jgi:hypothetical protein
MHGEGNAAPENKVGAREINMIPVVQLFSHFPATLKIRKVVG